MNPGGHSPLGGSGAARFIRCPGSVTLAGEKTDDDNPYAAEGRFAHSMAEWCLLYDQPLWRAIADLTPPPETDYDLYEMSQAVQKYLDALEKWHPRAERNQYNTFIEKKFFCPGLHEYFYGTSDFVFVDYENRTLHIWDYKHGAGVVVEVEDNDQCRYYAAGIMEELQLWAEIDLVVIHIAQPRAWHLDGPIRSATVPTSDLKNWLYGTLLPAMVRALVDTTTVSGSHCRFCPVRYLACPSLLADLEEAETLMTKLKGKVARELKNAEIARILELHETLSTFKTAALKTGFARAQKGYRIPGFKLADKRANREWKDEARATRILVSKFGEEALTEKRLKSPAQIEQLPEGEYYAARYAHKPHTGQTLVRSSDTRSEVSKSTKSHFKPVTKGRTRE